MSPGGPTPDFEQTPALPEQASEAPETGASFESPTPSPEPSREPVIASPLPAPGTQRVVAAPAPKDSTVIAVEQVMEEGLEASYRAMPPELQAKFRTEGERVSTTIADMVRHAKIKAVEVLKLLTAWLRMIPHVNRFFLAQEAKIKTDKILKL